MKVSKQKLKDNPEAKVKELFPELFKPEMEIGKYYKNGETWFCYQGESNECGYPAYKGYGVCGGDFIADKDESYHGWAKKFDFWTLMTDTEVQEALEKEAVKKYTEGDKIKPIKGWYYGKTNDFIITNLSDLKFFDNKLIAKNQKCGYESLLFQDGKWAEIIEGHELITYTVTEALEALKKANPGKRITIDLK